MDRKKVKKIILMRSSIDIDNKIIPLLEQEGLDFETVDANQLVCNGYWKHSNILVIPEFFYNILDNCMVNKVNSNKLDTILVSNSPYTMIEMNNNSKSLNILDYININSKYDKIKSIIIKHLARAAEI